MNRLPAFPPSRLPAFPQQAESQAELCYCMLLYLGAARRALTTIATGERPTSMELKNDFGWDHVSLGDFAYNEEAAHLEMTLHKKLQYRLR